MILCSPVSLKHDGTDGTPNSHCANDRSILTTRVFGHFCNDDHYVVAFRVITKYIFSCPCFGVDNFRQF